MIYPDTYEKKIGFDRIREHLCKCLPQYRRHAQGGGDEGVIVSGRGTVCTLP